MKASWLRPLGRLAALLLIALLALQLYFVARIALMTVIDPQSTTFQRSEAWRLLTERGRIERSQQWVDGERIATTLKRAVIASEDAAFTEHAGVDWDAIERAWERNQRAEAQAERRSRGNAPRGGARCAQGGRRLDNHPAAGQEPVPSGERTPLRKAQEFVLTLTLEVLPRQASHPGDLSEQRRVGRGRVRCASCRQSTITASMRHSSVPSPQPAWR